jgi:hypothetical protein
VYLYLTSSAGKVNRSSAKEIDQEQVYLFRFFVLQPVGSLTEIELSAMFTQIDALYDEVGGKTNYSTRFV